MLVVARHEAEQMRLERRCGSDWRSWMNSEQPAGIGFIDGQLRFQCLDRCEFPLVAQMCHEVQTQGGIVDVAVEVEDMYFDAAVASVVQCGAMPDA